MYVQRDLIDIHIFCRCWEKYSWTHDIYTTFILPKNVRIWNHQHIICMYKCNNAMHIYVYIHVIYYIYNYLCNCEYPHGQIQNGRGKRCFVRSTQRATFLPTGHVWVTLGPDRILQELRGLEVLFGCLGSTGSTATWRHGDGFFQGVNG